jgi:DNA-binding MarR family transcriptional regulator
MAVRSTLTVTEPVRPEARSDERASELLLAFVRLARSNKQSEMPEPLRQMLVDGGLAPRHLAAFTVIALEGELTVSELARREGYALSTTSLLVTQLAEAGLVVRREDTLDRRRTVVTVAPQYREQSASLLKARLAPLHRALDRLGPNRSRALMEGLSVLAEEIALDQGGSKGVGVTKARTQKTLHKARPDQSGPDAPPLPPEQKED